MDGGGNQLVVALQLADRGFVLRRDAGQGFARFYLVYPAVGRI
jgi:hypothetical protein